jgi:hypothetical protein
MRVCLIVVTCVLASVSVVSAQSLADVARKESERRQDVKPAAKTYTNTDLKGARTTAADVLPADGASAGAAAATDSSPSGAAETEKPANDAGGAATPDDAAKRTDGGAEPSAAPAADATTADAAEAATDERDRTGAGRADEKGEEYWADRMARMREQLERNETFLAALQSRVNALTTDFVNRDDPAQRAQISNDRQKALAEIERLEKQIQEDRKAIPELEEEARRAGVPAGWLR